jgi:hypothetical protein
LIRLIDIKDAEIQNFNFQKIVKLMIMIDEEKWKISRYGEKENNVNEMMVIWGRFRKCSTIVNKRYFA